MSIENTAESLYLQEWKCKLIIGYGAGIYVGTGVEAFYIAKCINKEISDVQLMHLYQTICDQHNAVLKFGRKMKQRRPGILKRTYKKLFGKTDKPVYDYPPFEDTEKEQA